MLDRPHKSVFETGFNKFNKLLEDKGFMVEYLHIVFTVYALVITGVSLYYIREHVLKLREVEWE